MTINLTIGERLTLRSILPEQGNYVLVTKAKELAEKLSLTSEELDKYVKKAEDNLIHWTEEGMKATFDIQIGEVMFEHLKKTLKEMDQDNKLKMEHVTLYEKITEAKEEKEPEKITEKDITEDKKN